MKTALSSLLVAFVLSTQPIMAQTIVPAAEIVAACQAERDSLPDRDRSSERKASPKSEVASNAPSSACKEFMVGYFKATLGAEAQARANAASSPDGSQKLCIRLPDFVPFRELADIYLDYARARPDLSRLSAKALADQAFGARYPCPGR